MWKGKLYFKKIRDIFFPLVCAGCGKQINTNSLFCAECQESIQVITLPFCQICGRPFPLKYTSTHVCGGCLKNPPFFKAARSVFIYTEPIKRSIIQFKFKGNTALANDLAKMLLFHLQDFLGQIKPETVIPVPLHLKRLRERGYNQCVLLAQIIAKYLKIPCEKMVLKKVKPTLPQVGLSQAQRHKNVKGSFAVIHPQLVKGKRILLIDDVFTTGSTVNECAKVLHKAGASGVWVATLSRTADVS